MSQLIYIGQFKVTQSGINKGKNASGKILGYYQSQVSKKTYTVYVGSCIEKLAEYMYYAFVAHDLEKKVDSDKAMKKAFIDALYFEYSYVKEQSYENICKAFEDVFSNGYIQFIPKNNKRFFKSDIAENDKAMMLWAVSHPIEFWGGMKDLENIRLGTTDTSNSSIFGIEIKQLGMWAALGAFVVFLIKGIKK